MLNIFSWSRMIIFKVILFLPIFAFAAPTVTDIVAKQRFPWNGLVDITCTVTGIEKSAPYKFYIETHHPDYKKHIVQQRFDLTSVRAAITHAAATCPTDALPLSTTGTNVGELVRRILTSTVDRSQ